MIILRADSVAFPVALDEKKKLSVSYFQTTFVFFITFKKKNNLMKEFDSVWQYIFADVWLKILLSREICS